MLSIDPRQDRRQPAAVADDMIDRALVRREQREELHRQDRGGGEEMLDHRFVRHRADADPFEALQAALERGLAVLGRRHAAHDQPESLVRLKPDTTYGVSNL